MRHWLITTTIGILAIAIGGNEADGRGFGGFRGGGGWGGDRSWGGGGWGGDRSESWGRSGFDSFGGSRSSSFDSSRSSSYGGWDHSSNVSGSRTGGAYAGGGRAAAGGSYDRSYSGSGGGSINTSGERGVVAGPRGVAGGSTRDTTATGPNGRTYDGSESRGAAVGPYGRYAGGSTGSRTATGPRGTASSSWQSAFAGSTGHFATDGGLAHYSSFNAASVSHTTAFHSYGDVSGQSAFVRSSFGYTNAFHAGWYGTHPNCWTAAGWAAGAAWTAATWPAVTSWCAIPTTPIYYDYGNNVVIQGDTVNVNGQNEGTPQQFATQATTIADAGQTADPKPTDEWKPLGIFALVQGQATSSNNIFQLAVDKNGIIRGNYYDGLMDTTTPVYGSVDKKTQRAAWTIGKKNDRVFDAGIANLTQDHAPVLVHIGKDKTEQLLLVRVPPQQGTN